MTHSRIEMLSPELQVSDLDRSIDFYRRAFGFEVSWCVGKPPELACLCRDNAEFTLRVVAAPTPIHLYFTVAGVDASYATALSEGARELVPLEDRWYGMRDGRVADPDGNQIGLGQSLEDRAAK
jgi:PhnB protein